MTDRPRPPAGLRYLNSRSYSGEDARQWSTGWHAPRLNRWERLRAADGRAVIERLEPAEITAEPVPGGGETWIGPGERWRLASLAPAASLEIAPHARDAASSSRPPRAREHWLAGPEEVSVEDARALRERLGALSPGERRLVHGAFDWRDAVAQRYEALGQRLSWHPLDAGTDGRFSALAIHARQPVDLVDYLGRDHAVIEAALSLAARGGEAERARFRCLLLRHVAIEEELLFPAYGTTPERERMVGGLLREHRYIRECLEHEDDPAALRRLWRLLEAHDEKEEQLVYPGIAPGGAAARRALLHHVLTFPAPPA